MRVAICDNENEWISRIEEYLFDFKKIYKNVEWDVFYSGEELLNHYEQYGNIYDIIIMDIELHKMSGIETANRVRIIDSSVVIFFLTSYKEYVYDCFKSSPLNFWIKPVQWNVFYDDMREAIQHINNDVKFIKVTENRTKIRVKCSSIVFLENVERKTCIHTIDELYKINKLLSELSKELDDNVFVRVYKSYIVNLAYVHIIEDNTIKLYNSDRIIPIGRSYKGVLTEKYINFKEKENF